MSSTVYLYSPGGWKKSIIKLSIYHKVTYLDK